MRRLLVPVLSAFFAAGCATIPAIGPSPASVSPENFSGKALALPLACTVQMLPHSNEPGAKKNGSTKDIHPSFYGCWDWHSAVHSHWALLRLLNLDPSLPERAQIIAELNLHLSKESLTRELEFLKKHPNFEWPYGSAWLLRLAQEAELSQLPEAAIWREALSPLSKFAENQFQRYLGKQSSPTRWGLHENTAFALTHVWDYAEATRNQSLLNLVKEKALKFYANDKDCAIASEPLGNSFISPCLAEVDLMRRMLQKSDFDSWLEKFLPEIPENYFEPTLPKDPKGYQDTHLIGLMYQKASAMRALALRLHENDPLRAKLLASSELHARSAWKMMFDSEYGGTHWLASFAIFYYTEVAL